MKAFIKAALLVACFGLVVGCESNTQKENTAIGAATGAVVGGVAGSAIGAGTGQVAAIGVGVVAGALIGGAIGHSMDSSDQEKATYVMEHNPPHKPMHWKNKTGTRYTMMPTSKHYTYNGNPHCRKYSAVMYVGGKKEHTKGIACREANGSWKTVS